MKKNNQKSEIIWNIVNSLMAGGLVFLGGLSSGNLRWGTITAALIASAVVALTKFSDYWKSEETEYKSGRPPIFTFIH